MAGDYTLKSQQIADRVAALPCSVARREMQALLELGEERRVAGLLVLWDAFVPPPADAQHAAKRDGWLDAVRRERAELRDGSRGLACLVLLGIAMGVGALIGASLEALGVLGG